MIERFVVDDILHEMLVAKGADISDLNISVDRPLQVETGGALVPIDLKDPLGNGYLSAHQTEVLTLSMIGRSMRNIRDLVLKGSADLGYQLRKEARFRVNAFFSRGNCTIVLRKLSTEIPTLEDIKSPQIFREVIKENNGMILVTGSTGSGKSTTLAAMLRALNETRAIHVVTLEDPVEFVHKNAMATFNQRELGNDYDSFLTGLRAALRQAPKVILVGEMRDRETMEIGLEAAETGHLVMSTLHTVDAGQTINRIIGMFDKDQEEQIRMRLASTLRWVVCQRLIKKIGGGRVAAHEIMGNNLRTKELIMQGEDEVKNFFSVIESAEPMGWKTFESSLFAAFREGKITEEDALLNSTRKNIMRRMIDYLKTQKGEITSDIKDIGIDKNYVQRIKKEI